MNIKSGCGYPGSALSNFAPHKFIIDNVECNSMEGFLQALKFKDPVTQRYVCGLVGKKAKFKGKNKKWFQTQKLYWLGVEYDRNGDEYQKLLDRAYNALFENSNFKKALKASGKSVFKHSIGQKNKSRTVLTINEFCSRLTKLRDKL